MRVSFPDCMIVSRATAGPGRPGRARDCSPTEEDLVGTDELVVLDKPSAHVTQMTLNKPDRLNSMSFGLVEALYAAIEEVAADNDTWVVVLTGAGRGFCSGLDLHDRGMPPNIEGLGFSRLAMRSMSYMGGVVPAMRALPQPVVAAINGPAIGGGLCLALGADIRFAGSRPTSPTPASPTGSPAASWASRISCPARSAPPTWPRSC